MTKNPHNLALAVLLLIQWGSSLASSSYSSFLSLNDPNQHTGTILNEARRKLGERWYYRGSKSGKSSKSKSAKSSKSGHYRKRRPDVDSNPNVEPDAGEPSDTSPNDSSPTVFNPDSAPQPSPSLLIKVNTRILPDIWTVTDGVTCTKPASSKAAPVSAVRH